METPAATLQRRALETIELHEIAIELVRQRLRNESPEASESEITARLREFLSKRPGPWQPEATRAAPK